MHDTIAMMLRTKSKTITEEEHAEQEVDNAISSCLHALRCVVNKTMQTSPGALVFHRDMLMNIPLITDLDALRGRRQQLIDDLSATARQNLQHHTNDYTRSR